MRILFVNEKLGFFGGVEQNIADTAAGLRERGHECFLAWGEKTNRDPDGYASLFQGNHACADVGAADNSDSLSSLARRTNAEAVYLHKIAHLPDFGDFPTGCRKVRMVHDHDLCCPRRHKYFVHNARVCHHPFGWRCWLDLAFIERSKSGPLPIALRSLSPLRREMEHNRSLGTLLVGSRFMREELLTNGFPPDNVSILPPMVRMSVPARVKVPESQTVLFVGQLIRGKRRRSSPRCLEPAALSVERHDRWRWECARGP